jgi:hypothetical protein
MIAITIKYTKKMTYKLTYANFQAWYFPSRQLALWKKKQLKASGNYSREFKIETV